MIIGGAALNFWRFSLEPSGWVCGRSFAQLYEVDDENERVVLRNPGTG